MNHTPYWYIEMLMDRYEDGEVLDMVEMNLLADAGYLFEDTNEESEDNNGW